MKNFIQHGDMLTLIAPTGGVVAGKVYKIGSIVVVAAHDAAETAEFEGKTTGVFTSEKTTGQTWAQGATLYFDPATGKFTTVAGSLAKAGVAVKAADSAAATGVVKLIPTL